MNQDQPGLYKGISALGQGAGLIAAILGTPLLYEATKKPLFLYLYKSWGKDFAELLVLAMGAIEAYVIYTAVSLIFTAGTIWLITTLAMRRFKD